MLNGEESKTEVTEITSIAEIVPILESMYKFLREKYNRYQENYDEYKDAEKAHPFLRDRLGLAKFLNEIIVMQSHFKACADDITKLGVRTGLCTSFIKRLCPLYYRKIDCYHSAGKEIDPSSWCWEFSDPEETANSRRLFESFRKIDAFLKTAFPDERNDAYAIMRLEEEYLERCEKKSVLSELLTLSLPVDGLSDDARQAKPGKYGLFGISVFLNREVGGVMPQLSLPSPAAELKPGLESVRVMSAGERKRLGSKGSVTVFDILRRDNLRAGSLEKRDGR